MVCDDESNANVKLYLAVRIYSGVYSMLNSCQSHRQPAPPRHLCFYESPPFCMFMPGPFAYFSNIIAVQSCFEPGYFISLLVRYRWSVITCSGQRTWCIRVAAGRGLFSCGGLVVCSSLKIIGCKHVDFVLSTLPITRILYFSDTAHLVLCLVQAVAVYSRYRAGLRSFRLSTSCVKLWHLSNLGFDIVSRCFTWIWVLYHPDTIFFWILLT